MYTPRTDKGKEKELRYSCLAYYYVGKEKLAYRFKSVKTMAGVRSFSEKNRYNDSMKAHMKIEYTDKKTGITKQY